MVAKRAEPGLDIKCLKQGNDTEGIVIDGSQSSTAFLEDINISGAATWYTVHDVTLLSETDSFLAGVRIDVAVNRPIVTNNIPGGGTFTQVWINGQQQ